MFDQLFPDSRALARQQDGPLPAERRRHLVHCAERQMAPKTLQDIARYTPVVATTLRRAERPGELITPAEIEAAADRWADRRSTQLSVPITRQSWRRFSRYARRWLSFLGRLQPARGAPQPYPGQVSRFADHMRQERGLSPGAIAILCQTTHEFLARLGTAGRHLGTLTAAPGDDLVARRVHEGGYARITARGHVYRLRAFFRCAEANAWCRPGLAAAIAAPRAFRAGAIPAGPSWDDVKRLPAAAQGDRPADIRARAALMLLAVDGPRAGEVVGSRLEDSAWGRELLTARYGKRQRPRLYPLCRAVGDAVLRSLRQARPGSARREVFLKPRAPFGPLSCRLLGHLVRPRLRALGGAWPPNGPHALRHACATHLLGQGLSVKEIGDHLGHQSPETTRLYAKVDLVSLRAAGDFDLEGLL
jgi:site-specific recombinase XerD